MKFFIAPLNLILKLKFWQFYYFWRIKNISSNKSLKK